MKNLSSAIVIILIVGGMAFYGGTKYQESKTSQFEGRFPGGQFPGGFQGMRGDGPGGPGGSRAGRQGFRPVMGEILSKEDKSITVKMQDGSSKIVLISDDTSISKPTEVSLKDIKKGEKVGVFGAENSDGSVSAQNIQLNPRFQNMPGTTSTRQ